MTDTTPPKLKSATELLAKLNGAKAMPSVDDEQAQVDAINFVMNGIHSNILNNKIPLELATPALVQLTANYVAACPVKISGAVDDYRRRLIAARNEINRQKEEAMKAAAAGK